MAGSRTHRRTLAALILGASTALGTLTLALPPEAAQADSAGPPTATPASMPDHPLDPMAGDQAFAALRGPDYLQHLAEATEQASHAPLVDTVSHGVDASWTALGPEPVRNSIYGGANSGRVTGLALSGSTLIAATAGGGLWSTTNDGASWQTNPDGLDNIAIGSVGTDPSDSAIVFAGTGESNSCGDCYHGDGVLLSTDGGQSWQLTGSGIPDGTRISSIVVEPGASSLATTTVLAGADDNLYVSNDGGGSWAAETGTGWVRGKVDSVVINPLTSPVTIYAGVSGVGVEESVDNGTDWGALTLPASMSTSLSNALAIVPNASASSTVLYASMGSNSTYLGMFKSVDGGSSWSQIPNCTSASQQHCIPFFTSSDYAYNGKNDDPNMQDQSYYDNTVAVDPQNPNIVVAAGIIPVESTNGGTDWVNLNGEAYFAGGVNFFHPDFHALQFDPSQDLYLGNDGGVWEASAAAVENPVAANLVPNNFANLNTNLDITQFYGGLSQVDNGSMILAGAQDNGTPLYSSAVSPSTGWEEFDTGDGGWSVIDPANPEIMYSEADIQASGSIDRSTNGGAEVKALATQPAFQSVNWAAPLVLVPPGAPTVNGLTLYFGANGVFKTTDGGNYWSVPTSTSYTGSDVSAIALAPSNSQVVYAGYNDGTLQVSTDGGTTWTTLVSAGSAPVDGHTITHIAVSATDPGTAYLTTATVNTQTLPTNAGDPVVLQGTGLTSSSPQFTDESGNLEKSVPTNSVISDGANGLLVATDVGVFWAGRLQGSGTVWSRLGTGMPNVQVVDLTMTSDDTLLAVTHGRGAWSFPFSVTSTTTNLVASLNPVAVGEPVTYTATVAPAAGVSTQPTGTVSFTSNGSPLAGCTAVPLTGGTATCTTSYPSTGTYGPITGTYSGDSSFTGSASASLSQQVQTGGYWEAGADGGIFAFGNAAFFGSTGGMALAAPIVAMASTPDSQGYWLVGRDGGVFAFGNAGYFGSMGGRALNAPIVALAPTPDGRGYWLVGADGGVFAFGDAGYFGSMGGRALNAPIVGMAADPATGGYWEVASDGGIFAFNAPFEGSTGGQALAAPIVAMAATPDGQGYWFVGADGGVFAYGNAEFFGSMGGHALNQPVVGITTAPGGTGYWLVAADGGLFAFGSAPFFGSTAGQFLNKPIVAMASWG